MGQAQIYPKGKKWRWRVVDDEGKEIAASAEDFKDEEEAGYCLGYVAQLASSSTTREVVDK